MKLKSIYLSRQNWGPDTGKVQGKIEYDNQQATINLVLSEETAAKIVNLVAEDTLRQAQELAGIMISDVQVQLLGPKVESLLIAAPVPEEDNLPL